ncbi:conserved hypothetical protein [Pseudomonas sp. 8Z]|uniref:hypothetical protein n=1 Tax=Pseudomonas sp. 8Z TaxID=2653166 RepID=UPI0012EF5A6C|nr:hypothetical protein [Pseudomonas sp. 8Z]VXC72157.1 conserved hypothetical protein [Pseudomonas sp. 8Z]
MVTRDQLEIAKALWEQVRIGCALAHQNWQLLNSSRQNIINSLVNQGFTATQAVEAFNEYYQGHQEQYEALFKAMTERADEYKLIEDQWKAQKSEANS